MTVNDNIRDALSAVYDPCSIGQNNPVSIYDMGLVRDWVLDEDGRLTVNMCVTSPLCMMSPHFVSAAKAKLRDLPEVSDVDVLIDPSIMWTPELMTKAGADSMSATRRKSMRLAPVTPQAWRSGAAG
ncbi:MAG: Metal-sulfur cluster biosynthetic enzyme [Pseudonocardiales bacterium]|jgi:metal-sulfur cluster biosynthetic enzyme|nr:Metal-sulfur cluster biosynthetic enzyme [Pseudonocardiales bacterium]